jgi:UDP:flavonoid glycosyltransferase YjiC (YdhE family)
MSGATFATAVRELLAGSAVASQLSHYRAALQGVRAVERAADLLENVARSSARAA